MKKHRFYVTRRSEFSAAHFLRNYNGKCENLHGHNWRVEATLFDDNLDEQGMVVDFHELDRVLKDILSELDHKIVNDVPFFKERNPTAENIALYVFEKLKLHFGERVERVVVYETERSSAEVRGIE